MITTYVLASESCALTSVGAEFIRDIEPGEMVTISRNGVESNKELATYKPAHCVFEYIYFARLDSEMDGVQVSTMPVSEAVNLLQNLIL